jgi:A/G-specific adenine glycosylase
MLIHDRILLWWSDNKRSFPWRDYIFDTYDTFELNGQAIDRAYCIFIAEFLLMRTNAPQVSLIYKSFLSMFPNFESIINCDENDLLAIFSNMYSFSNADLEKKFPIKLGFEKRVHWLIEMSKKIEIHYNILEDLKKLLELEGLGQYTARAFLVQYKNENFIPIDTNIVRLFSRVYGFPGLTLCLLKAYIRKLK